MRGPYVLKTYARILRQIKKVQQRQFNSGPKFVSQMFQNARDIQPLKSDSVSKSHKLFMNNDILHQCHSGAFHMLPLGFRVLQKLIQIIDSEMDAIGAQKMSMPTLSPKNLWQKSGRWDETKSELFTLQDRHKKSYCLGPTHEELVTDMVQTYNYARRRLPIKLYQITRKFRDEMAPKHGLLRGREFEMKDLYTFDSTEENAMHTYDLVCEAYEKIFNRLGMDFIKAEGSTGNIGGKMSHEFHFLSDIGEDTVDICSRCGLAANIEVSSKYSPDGETWKCKNSSCDPKDKTQETGIEVGHSFLLGTKYSKVFNATYQDEERNVIPLQMGCYGLGVTRIMQASVEVLSTEDNICWPREIAPYKVCILPQKKGYLEEKFMEISTSLGKSLCERPSLSGEVIIDDRTKHSVGYRLKDAQARGYLYAVVIGRKAVENEEDSFELVDIYNYDKKFLSHDGLIQYLEKV